MDIVCRGQVLHILAVGVVWARVSKEPFPVEDEGLGVRGSYTDNRCHGKYTAAKHERPYSSPCNTCGRQYE